MKCVFLFFLQGSFPEASLEEPVAQIEMSDSDEEQLIPQVKTDIIKSPQFGVTLCFQFVSAAAAAKTFASHIKTLWASP